MSNPNYFIKEGYKVNIVDGKAIKVYTGPPVGDDYQYAVFQHIKKYIQSNSNVKTLVDLGCGTAFKINQFFKDLPIEITGVDQSFTVEQGAKNYPYINWIADDFGKSSDVQFDKYDVIISSDVIEHLIDPDLLLERVKKCAHKDSKIFLSTPERDLVRGKETFGPAPNKLHIREWNQDEFNKYLKSHGFKILEHKILPAKKLGIKETFRQLTGQLKNNTCQMVVCQYDG